MITPEPAEICGWIWSGRLKKRRKNGSRISGFFSSGLRCRTAMLTTAGVTFARVGASVGMPSRVAMPATCASAGQAANSRVAAISAALHFIRMDMASFYSTVRQRGHAPHAHQWFSLLTCAQERLVYAKALETVAPRSRVLDWGCGNGHFSYFLAEHGYHPDSYALSEIPPLLHQEKRISFSKGENRTTLPYPASTFDAVFALGVIEHVAEHGGSER